MVSHQTDGKKFQVNGPGFCERYKTHEAAEVTCGLLNIGWDACANRIEDQWRKALQPPPGNPVYASSSPPPTVLF